MTIPQGQRAPVTEILGAALAEMGLISCIVVIYEASKEALRSMSPALYLRLSPMRKVLSISNRRKIRGDNPSPPNQKES